ncbi:uncharacterized protein DEA37_0007823 [Paragonimus westermani]|uniref:Uncharacterized protein n=1 Tax=Paragonimus westermani TaxID=34504 RepID=A0A5J4NB72_9TREM|nr:uncharacterized protein DEA37_0007823 [Paragonimus westermani]
MFPCGVLFCGKTWDSVFDELKYFVLLDRSKSDNQPFMTWWKSQCIKLKNGHASPIDFLNNIQSQLQYNINSRYHEPTVSLCDFIRDLCSSRSVQDDCALLLFFHLLLPRAVYFALTGLLCTSTQGTHQTARSSRSISPENSGTTLLNRFLLELENLIELANRLDAFGTVTTKGGGSLSKLACILFDRLACLTFFATGATHKTHPTLWNTLYEETQAKSVELWCAFWLETDDYCLCN